MADNKRINEACRDNSINQWKVADLKDYLRSIGQHVSGNKSELVARVKGACKLGIDAEIERREDDRRKSIRREMEKLTAPDGETLLHPSCIDKWTDDVSIIPDRKRHLLLLCVYAKDKTPAKVSENHKGCNSVATLFYFRFQLCLMQ